MRFLVIVRSEAPRDISVIGEPFIRASRYREQLAASGKIVTHAHIAGHRAHMWIFDVASVDELDEVMSDDPMSAFFGRSPEIYPLTSPERMRERERAIAEVIAKG